ncbi:MAG: Long-chain acyl-(acyl-carrier-protein) reductase [Candidatus Omnitrophica bacterium ADurb.Bin314]|jgi:predicted amino acid dehydrogenase/ribosome-associated toxin RatA of RatAB toxin-antitoxin module|nr:MAG: Long-chain acyl-(acyl-carrier-protein) reductase [Candidatus Omnitrophica bacterium ADurb.Bin314]HOE68840.1 SRPBCC family protein [Candidatus Omnitrophota bacterium]
MSGSESSSFIKISRVLPAKRWQVLRLLTRVEDFPSLLPAIKECHIVDRDRKRSVTSWKVQIDGLPIQWREEAFFEYRSFTVRFRALEGDLESFEGRWILAEGPSDSTEITVEAAIRLGIPVMDQIVGGMVTEKIRGFFETLLRSFENALIECRYGQAGTRPLRAVSGFGVIGHPYNFQHLVSYLRSFNPDFKLPSQGFLAKIFDLMPSYVSYDVKEFRAESGAVTRGAFIVCNIIPEMLALDMENVIRKVVDSCKVAERHGLGIVALGGFTSIAGERFGKSFLKQVRIPVTTGNTLTAALAVEGVVKAAGLMGVDLARAKVTVIGGAGDIGSACARVLASMTREVTVTSRSPHNLKKMARAIKAVRRAKFRGSHDNNDAVKDADIVIAAASAPQSIVEISSFKPGAIVCDVGYPKNIAYAETDRHDILIFAGGICELPVEFNTGFDIGLPSRRVLYGCFSEAMVLALEGRYENYSWGKGHITKEKMDEILRLANKHGFRLAPFFWGHRQLIDQEIIAIGKMAEKS